METAMTVVLVVMMMTMMATLHSTSAQTQVPPAPSDVMNYPPPDLLSILQGVSLDLTGTGQPPTNVGFSGNYYGAGVSGLNPSVGGGVPIAVPSLPTPPPSPSEIILPAMAVKNEFDGPWGFMAMAQGMNRPGSMASHPMFVANVMTEGDAFGF